MRQLFNFFRNKFAPRRVRTFNVELLIHDNHNDRIIGKFYVDVDAPNHTKAKSRALEVLSLRVGRFRDITKLNGHKR